MISKDFLFSIYFFFGISLLFSQKAIPTYDYSDCDFQAIGHRGYSDIYPENTLLSIEEAFKRGVKYCEIDVNVTSDDVYVLFHDQPTMFRTSNGQGYVVSSTYNELLELDFGSWKGSQFRDTKIATLEEALLLAEKYDSYLYLDTKKFDPELMGKTLLKSRVDPSRLLAAIANLEEAKEFKKYCPNSSFIYFGGLPEDPSDDNWYKNLIDLGCKFFETYYSFALDETNVDFQQFLKKVHEHGAKVWVFTSNSLEEIEKIKNKGVDGVESDIATSAMKDLCGGLVVDAEPIRATTANHTFDNGDLQSTGVGSQLRPLNYNREFEYQDISFGTTSSFNIEPINGKIANIIKVPAFNPQNGLFLFTNFTSGIDANLHFNYSLILDIYIPRESKDKYISLFQSSPENSNDGELFINSGGVGINNEYHGDLKPETWYRLGIVVTETTIKKYINGNFIGENKIDGGRWSIYNVFAGGQDQGFLLFSDNNNETSEIFVSSIQLRNYNMNEHGMKLLGNSNSEGIPISNSGIYDLKFDGEIGQSIVNWDSNEIYVTFPKSKDLNSVKADFKIPYGANSSIISGSIVDLSSGSSILIITAQDGVSKTKWNIKRKIKETS